MSRSILTAFVLGLTVIAAPLHGQGAVAPAISAKLPYVALPAELDRVLRDYEHAWRAGDAAALALLFAEDGFVLQSNHVPVRGRPAIQAAYKGQAGGPLRLRALAFAAGNTLGYVVGTYSYGTAPHAIGKFTLTLRRAPGGQWLIFSDMDNLNAASKSQHPPEL